MQAGLCSYPLGPGDSAERLIIPIRQRITQNFITPIKSQFANILQLPR